MEQVAPIKFLQFAASRQIVPDPRYSEPRCLVFSGFSDASRFWQRPEAIRGWPPFIHSILEGLSPAFPCYLWPRAGKWISPVTNEHKDSRGIADRIHDLITGDAGIPAGFDGALKFEPVENDTLITVAVAQMLFGFTVWDDLFIVPEHAQAIVHLDHHNAVFASFASERLLEEFIRHMSRKGFDLPTELPDETFKKPEWMK